MEYCRQSLMRFSIGFTQTMLLATCEKSSQIIQPHDQGESDSSQIEVVTTKSVCPSKDNELASDTPFFCAKRKVMIPINLTNGITTKNDAQ